MRIGIMGGTLDPVHNGHLQIAQAVREACSLDSILLLPAGDPPHKKRKSGKFDRLEMAKRVVAGQPHMSVSDIEVLREGTTYTVDTLCQLHAMDPDVEWVYIIGADTVNVVHHWRNFPEVAQMCSFAAVSRPGFEDDELRIQARKLSEEYGALICFLNVSGPDISSTEIRNAVAQGRSIDEMVPKSVAEYIREKGLYLCDYSWDELEQKLALKLAYGRYRHTLGVAETAVRLASRNGVDPQHARLAALLHDCAKNMPTQEMIDLVRVGVPDADEEELHTEPVLHAPAGMIVARRDYGVKNPAILSAIRRHTLGDADMTPLETLIFVSDFIEPGRKPFEGLDEVRQMAETDLYAAARMCVRLSNEFIVRRGGMPHPRTLRMLKNKEDN